MATYTCGSVTSDRMHHCFMNYVKGEKAVLDPGDGRRYQVQPCAT